MRLLTILAVAVVVHVDLENGGGGRGLTPHGVTYICPEVTSTTIHEHSVDATFTTLSLAEECVDRLDTMDGVQKVSIRGGGEIGRAHV